MNNSYEIFGCLCRVVAGDLVNLSQGRTTVDRLTQTPRAAYDAAVALAKLDGVEVGSQFWYDIASDLYEWGDAMARVGEPANWTGSTYALDAQAAIWDRLMA